MLANAKDILMDAQKNHYAIAGINATTFEGIMAVLDAAEELGAPVMLSHAQSHEPFAPIDRFGPLMVECARRAKVPVIIHLDHGTDYNYVIKAVRNGFTSIMYDCAHMTFEENLAEVSRFVDLAHGMDIIVEAEVGRMPSNIVGQGGCTEYGVAVENIEDYFTLPEEAADFARRSGVDMLTVSFGTVHGFYVEKPKLDIARLKAIHDATPVALVMHGTTGVDEEQILAAIDNGVCKFNYFTGVGTCATRSIEKQIVGAAEMPLYYHELAHTASELMKEQAKYMIELFLNKK